MSKDRLRVLIFALAYVGLAAVAMFGLDWFEAATPGGRLSIGLHHATLCDAGRCDSVELSAVRGIGMYASGAWTTFWGTLLLTLIVGFQAFTRVTSGVANARLSRMAIFACLSMLTSAASCAYLFPPEPGPIGEALGLSLSRTSAPLLLIVAYVCGICVAYYAALDISEDDVGEYKPVVVSRPAGATAAGGIAAAAAAGGAAAVDRAAAAAAPGRPRPAPSPSTPPRPAPPHLARRVRFAVQAAELTRGGVDARREDGAGVLVMWRDVVGVIARRLPPELDGETFVDVVSTAGSTLRVLPWTRLTGERLLGDGDDRARALVTYAAAQCPGARIDPATRAFVEQGGAAEQLESAAELAAYDARLE